MKSPFQPVITFFKIAKALKSHGTGGKLRIAAESQFKSYFKINQYLFFDLNGSKVPFRIITTEEGAHFIVELEDVANKKDSDLLSGSDIWLPLESVKPRHQRSPRNLLEKWDQYALLDTNSQAMYPVLRVEEFPQQLMAIIMIDQKEKLIPLSEQLISLIDKDQKVIHMEIPEGLLDI